uniref:Uncharacterized protein n=1 Tax=Anopheles epiroticus TaxID=199890 RepID=A0A182PX81_9DIPT
MVAKLFDPLGLLAPVTVWAKIQMQALWIATDDWDEPIPPQMDHLWNEFQTDFWFHGSVWLKLSEDKWKLLAPLDLLKEEDLERKRKVFIAVAKDKPVEWTERFSHFWKCVK